MPSPDARGLFTAAPLPVAALDHAERVACLRLIRSDNVGPVTFRELINHCGGAKQALDALPELSRHGGRAIRICPEARALAELEAAHKIGARPVFTIEPGYPAALAHVEAPPPLLYVKGRAELLARPMIAIVGSRDASAAGRRLARLLAADLAGAGLVVVSGLARGVDAAAHEAALAGGTVAVLAGGIDIVYPPEHGDLQNRIGMQGCLVAEMPPGFEPRAKEFPRRNRIISGLSQGVIVVEAARRSGTLVTARLAGEQGREVFAVPGHPLDPRAEGTNQLIKSGATLITCADDVLEALRPLGGLADHGAAAAFAPEPASTAPMAPVASAPEARAQPVTLDNSDRDRVLGALGPAPVDVDEIGRATGLSSRAVQVALLELALAGRIERHGRHLVSLVAERGGSA